MTPTPHLLEQAFLDDIVAHADDPSLWLILADWLDEREDPRTELVRLTWQLQYEPEHRQFKKRQERVQALLAGGTRPVRPRRTLGDFEFAWVAPGSFLMGSPKKENHRNDDEQQHRVTLTRGFWMGVYPVTQGQWRDVMGDNPSGFSRGGERADAVARLTDADLEHLPVESVSWSTAQKFCGTLAQRLGRRVTLPTEAQWEYACRAGTTTAFHFGKSLDGTQANCDGNYPYGVKKKGPYPERPTVVGSYPPNAWGLYDMHGNVLEWCQDGYREAYEKLPATDPLSEGAAQGRRVLRGGFWYDLAYGCRAARRCGCSTGYASDVAGLRVCLSEDAP